MQDPSEYPIHLVWRAGLNLCNHGVDGDFATDLDTATCKPCLTEWQRRTKGACRSGTCAMGG